MITQLSVPRCFKPEEYGEVKETQLHVFCDASEVESSVVAYLRLIYANKNIRISFIMGKARLAPLKTVSIPRLELTAATLGAKVALFIKEEIDLDIDAIVMWTDSMAVLRYIASTKRRFKMFVANRLSIIQEITNADQWQHVPSAVNPADLGSRGIMPSDTGNLQAWLRGPLFLESAEDTRLRSPPIKEVS
jgi:hypothetical protein